MERVTTKQAAQELNMGIDTLQFMMQQERLPIGFAVKKEGKKNNLTACGRLFRNNGCYLWACGLPHTEDQMGQLLKRRQPKL